MEAKKETFPARQRNSKSDIQNYTFFFSKLFGFMYSLESRNGGRFFLSFFLGFSPLFPSSTTTTATEQKQQPRNRIKTNKANGIIMAIKITIIRLFLGV